MRYIVYFLLIFYAVAVGYNLYRIDMISKVFSLEWPELGSIAYVPILIFSLYVLNRTRKPLGLKSSERSIVLFALISIAFIMVPAIVIDQTTKASAAIFLAGFVAACGWLYTTNETRENGKKAHTLNILLQMRNSAEYNKHRSVIFKYLNDYDRINYNIISSKQKEIDDPDINLMQSARYIANYFEFICVGYVSRDLDEAILIKSMRSILIRFYEWFEPFLEEEKMDGSKYNPRIFENLKITVDEFKRKLAKEEKGK